MKKSLIYQSSLLNSKMYRYLLDCLKKTKEAYVIYWNFTICIIAMFHPKLQFLFALQLFSLYTEIKTMSIVLVSIKLRYHQFLAALLFIFALILFFSSLAFVFFNSDYNMSLENENNNNLTIKLIDSYLESTNNNNSNYSSNYSSSNNNVCRTMFSCFLYFIHNGIRGGLGFGFNHKTKSDEGYWLEFILEWVFYFTILLVMLNIINGIIVDTFEEMRETEAKKYEFKKNSCFICSVNRSKFELKSLNFRRHLDEEHNIANYYHYFIYLQSIPEEELNNKEVFVKKCLNNNLLDFFPIRRSLKLESKL